MKGLIFLLCFSIFLTIGALTNPDVEQHRDFVKIKVQKYMVQKGEADGQMISAGIALAFANRLIDKFVSRDNYIVFSLTRLTFQENSKTIGVGAFGIIWLWNDPFKEIDAAKSY